jgi:hypothetical protein
VLKLKPSLKRGLIFMVLIIAVFSVVSINCLLKNQKFKKPLPPRDTPSKEQFQPIDWADIYAKAISRLEYDKAKAMSNAEAAKAIDSIIKPKFAYWAKKQGVKRIKFSSVEFEKALLVNDREDNLIVLENLNFPHSIEGCKGFYLRLNIVKRLGSFQVVQLSLREKSE